MEIAANRRKQDCNSLFLSQNSHGKWLAWTSSPGYHLPPAVMTQSLSSSTSSPKWDTSSRHTRQHAPRRRHNSSFATSSHSMAFQPHSSPTETLSSPASSGKNSCLCSRPNLPCHPLTIRRQTDRLSASTRLSSNSSEQPARTRSPNGTCTYPSWSLPTTMLIMQLLDRRRFCSPTDATHSHHRNRQHPLRSLLLPSAYACQLPGGFTTPSMSNFGIPIGIQTRSSSDANRRRCCPSSSRMNPSTRSSPCLHTDVVGMAPWSFSSVGRVMILLRTAEYLSPTWVTPVVLCMTTFVILP
ncbi:hypothetical protein CLOM_g13369 [Closterium sp. NIES-68]|nr:hypothetical protein CLOM_g13369 [Closterium sp. NIES-68]